MNSKYSMKLYLMISGTNQRFLQLDGTETIISITDDPRCLNNELTQGRITA